MDRKVRCSVLKKVNQKTKKTLFQIWIVSLLALACLVIAVYVLYPSINIPQVSNTPSFLSPTTKSISTFYGENIDMSQILPTSQHYVVNSKGEDLIDIAADLGINLIRITNITHSFNNDADSVYTGDEWNQVLTKMQRKGIKALILIETSSKNKNYYTPDIQPVYLHLVQEYIDSGVFSNPDVYAVDIKNEPLLTDANISMLEAAHTMIREKYPHLKQTIGWWATPRSSTDLYKGLAPYKLSQMDGSATPPPTCPNGTTHIRKVPNSIQYNWADFSAGQKIADIVDFYSAHLYGLHTNRFGIGLNPDLNTKAFVSQLENSIQTKKPILIEEFGEANGDAVSDQNTIGNPQLQANIYQGVYQALKEMHNSPLIGAVAFDFYNRTPYPDAWAIVTSKGNNLLPAAYVLQEYALGENNSPHQMATDVHSQSYLFQNANNHTSINLHISDRIGLKLQLDDSTNYSVALTAQGILQPVESFYRDPVSNSYQTVYQATSKGRLLLSIMTNDICQTPVYTLTINVL